MPLLQNQRALIAFFSTDFVEANPRWIIVWPIAPRIFCTDGEIYSSATESVMDCSRGASFTGRWREPFTTSFCSIPRCSCQDTNQDPRRWPQGKGDESLSSRWERRALAKVVLYVCIQPSSTREHWNAVTCISRILLGLISRGCPHHLYGIHTVLSNARTIFA